MPSHDDLVPVADASAFIFTGSIARAGVSTVPTLPVNRATVVVSVEHVIKAPAGLRGLKGSEVTVQLEHPLAEGSYVFFAEPLAVGSGIAVKERAHLDVKARGEAEAAVERGYTALIERRAREAFLVALGTVGEVAHLLPVVEQQYRGPWAKALLEIERVLKGARPKRRVILVGPSPAWKRLPRTPGLRSGLRGIFILRHPPAEAIKVLGDDERQTAAFIAETSDIQPPERLDTILQVLKSTEKE